MSFVSAFAFGFLAVILGARALSRPFVVRNIEKIFWTAVLVVVAVLTITSHLQFAAWASGDPIAQRLVPPLGGHQYFLFYVWWRFWAPYAISFVVSGIFFLFAWFYNRRHGEQFFYDEEYYFIALGIFLSGQPGWILYIFAMILFVSLIAFIRRIFLHQMDKFSLYDFWLPMAAFGILIMQWLAQLPLFVLLKM